MPTHEEHIVRILGESTEPLLPSEIAARLNHELGPGSAYTTTEVTKLLWGLAKDVTQTADEHWIMKQRMG